MSTARSPKLSPADSNDSVDEEAGTISDQVDSVDAGSDHHTDSYNTKQSWKQVAYLSFTSLGAIYGDIGTSPLYVLNTIKYPNSPPTKQDIYGGISAIFYLFTLIVVIKYVMIVLFIGPNNGEGGQVAIYAKIARHLKIGPKGVTIPGGPEKDDMVLLARQETSSSFLSMNKQFNEVKNSPMMIKFISKLILGCCFLGCALVMSDGLLTPTTSVLSAIEGIKIAQPSFHSSLGVSEAVLVFLFLMQSFGSAKIALAFAPIIFLWLIGLFVIGIINIVKFHPGVFQALSPYYAIELLKHGGIDVIGGAMLSITGAEAMFADIGHFGRLPVQFSMTLFVYPCLIITYLGQAAYCIENPEGITSPFYLSIPGGTNGGFYWVMFVLATLSTIIASQALILGVFSIVGQLINLDCFPKFKIIHVSKNYAGKVYIPMVNWLLMIGVCATTAGFGSSAKVTAAYGLGISLDFFVTSILLIVCMIYVYQWNYIIPIIFGLIFLPLEAVLVISNLKKFIHGAWFPLLMAGVAYCFLSFWRWARSKKVEQEFKSRVSIGDLYPELKRVPVADTVDLKKYSPLTPNVPPNGESRTGKIEGDEDEDELNEKNDEESLDSRTSIDVGQVLKETEPEVKSLSVKSFFGNHSLKRYDGVAIMYSDVMHTINSPNTVPWLYKLMIQSFSSIPTIFVFCAIRVISIPNVPEEERILVANMKIPGHFRCVVRFGFSEEVKIDEKLLDRILNSFPDTSELVKRFNNNGILEHTANIPILHVFENELIRSHRYSGKEYATRSPLKICQRYARKFLINHCFSPINNALQSKGQVLKIDEETLDNQRKLFLGSVVRV
ncbi:putative high affinity potassium transporter [[Candida] railenensis]|uniref:High affinity potassium transporter n=1 Tax=[Candida] railenensis TaxID=45579 RepID=A0A9P0QQ59_9ASCO|nr:putative high affinity potassium transporter [[Candida] railenensis]